MAAGIMRGRVTVTTPVLDTAILASGDVMNADGGTKVVNAADASGSIAILESLVVVDNALVKGAFDILLFSAKPTSLAAANAAVSVTDAEMDASFLGAIAVAAADFKDTALNSYATYPKVGIMVQAAAGTQDIYAVLVARAASTYGAAGLTLRFGFRQS